MRIISKIKIVKTFNKLKYIKIYLSIYNKREMFKYFVKTKLQKLQNNLQELLD